MSEEIISKELNSDTINLIGNFENWFKQLISNPIYLSAFLDIEASEESLQSIESIFETYKSVYNIISQYNAVQYRDDTAEYFTNAKQKMSTMIPIYERFLNNYRNLLSVLSEKTEPSTLEEFTEIDHDFEDDFDAYQNIIENRDEFAEEDCSDDGLIYPECHDLSDQISNEISSYMWKKDLRIILFGNDFDKMKMNNNLVRPDLRSIQLAPQNLLRENY